MDLFNFNRSPETFVETPLAEKFRPKDLQSFKGLNSSINYLFKTPILPNIILWGPPGVGKTSLALLISQNKPNHQFINLNAIDTGAKKIKEIGEAAQRRKIELNQSSIVFIDEIHRLNKAQQDVLLPFTEKGVFSLIGATTENPSFELNKALLSRCQLIVLNKLSSTHLIEIINDVFEKSELAIENILLTETISFIAESSNGDARRAINIIDAIINKFRSSTTNSGSRSEFPVSTKSLTELIPTLSLRPYDKSSDEHYDTISAFIKSIRGSDPDAGLYYLSRMIQNGEDPIFVARRLVILASEDIGNADPRALQIAVAGMQAVQLVGLPEAEINLAQVVTYLATAPKSNKSYQGLLKARKVNKEFGSLEIPSYLKSSLDTFPQLKNKDGSYKYAHDYPTHYASGVHFLPKKLKDLKIYEPSQMGYEKKITEFIQWLKKGFK
ncbi:MAG: replication-associated recombination protein A [Bdellovibrionales bacterium]|nr:replication-associated recombination protein A [Bdellovibrionales bacterium]